MSDNLQKAFSPATLGKLPLKNRRLKAATYEGKTPDGIPGDLLLDFHKDIVAGGTAMTTIGYCTTEADGRINDQMMWMHDGIRDKLTHMNTVLKETAPDVKISGQMTHCGNFSKNRKLQRLKRPMGPSRQFNMLGAPSGLPFAGAMKIADIDYLVQTYHDAALLMKETGFDAAGKSGAIPDPNPTSGAIEGISGSEDISCPEETATKRPLKWRQCSTKGA